ncbi:nitrite reductase small subunit NirD [Arthrobacter sp. UKPF54-2]|uniref:nitrite reductase small subunit NirD n=1 Tax=Arthrobacter sp. UKPF54-2 TaxID=2600159 RepID=UPI0011B1BCEB|nr:nitrite reductase small subunit NirD [Arthrobacter sp. UKPF54-2]QDY88886.1 nitrite reductase small subunit NirD [Arthrobacter sp. UKPF54-2]
MTAVLESAARSFVERTAGAGPAWHRVCAVEDLEPGWGEAALIAGRQVALFRTATGVFAVEQADPATGAHVMARGITGSRGTRPTLASPLHKEVYDLGTGECLGNPELRLGTYAARVADGFVEVEL